MRWLLVALFMAMAVSVSPVEASAGGAVVEMAKMVIHLKHYPSEAEKKRLAVIASDPGSTAGEKVIAGALMRMKHYVGDDDSSRLMRLEKDKTAPAAERELATILNSIAHHPTDADIKRLKALTR